MSIQCIESFASREYEERLEEDVRSHIVRNSIHVLRMNDRGGYTVPAEGLYPFQVTQSLYTYIYIYTYILLLLAVAMLECRGSCYRM